MFLTPENRQPRNASFRHISYTAVARVLDKFSALAEPEEVRLFAKHYASALRKYVIAASTEQEESNNEKQIRPTRSLVNR